MMNYKTKSSPAKAIQWSGKNLECVVFFMDKELSFKGKLERVRGDKLFVKIPLGRYKLAPGDWIISWAGSPHIMTDREFKETFEVCD